MGTQQRDPDSPVAQRLRALRESYDMNGPQFAAHVGIDYRRWHNYERGLPLPIGPALQLCQKIPGLNLHWIYQGTVNEDMPLRLARRLGVLTSDRPRKTK